MTGGFDRGERSFRYYRDAVERHWDPGEIDLTGDLAGVAALEEREFDGIRSALAKFGAGEEAVTEDLAPLAVVLDDTADELFVTTQLYEEAKHADFFDRYWTEVVNEAERERGLDPTDPRDDRWFDDDYVELFDRMETAMHRLLTDDSPGARAAAYCHYHLVIEGILAQTGYYGLQTTYGPETEETPHLAGLCTGLDRIRRDEGRHVGFGMAKLKALVRDGAVSAASLHETVGDLVPLVTGTTTDGFDDVDEDDVAGPGPADLVEYATGKHTQRMRQITSASAEIPDVETLTKLEGD